MARLKQPPLGTGVVIATHFPRNRALFIDGVPYTSVTFAITPAGLVETRNAVARDQSTGEHAASECEDGSYIVLGSRWSSTSLPIGWRLDKRSAPPKLPDGRLKKKVIRGFRAWARPRTACDGGGASSFRFKNLGTTRKNPALDGVNTVDFGSLGSDALAMTYTWYVGSETVEFDIRLNKANYRWTLSGRNKKRFHVQNAIAHEVGHVLSLDDLGDEHGALTMFGSLFKGETKKTTLGRGDTLGVQDTSP